MVGVLLSGCFGSEQQTSNIGEGAPAGSTTPTAPSSFAERKLPLAHVQAYIDTASERGLDWTVLAAADATENGVRASSPDAVEERVESLAYTLLATGAPSNYLTALTIRGGSQIFAERVLTLAERFRGAPEGEQPQVSRDPLDVPVDGQLVAGFGQRYGLLHDGVDIEAPLGTPILAAADGLVLSSSFDPAFGNYSCLLHRLDPPIAGETTITSCYGNQSRIDVEVGERVARGQTIGAVGCSGPCLRPHVHLQIKAGMGADAISVDPVPFFGGELGELGAQPALE